MNKEEYKAMKEAWAKAVNNKDNKPYKSKKYGNKLEGKINSVHYLVYNILRQMPEERGFEPVGEGFDKAKARLAFYIKYKPEILIYPFNGTVTIEQLGELL